MCFVVCIVFFFNDTATTEIYTLSLHDALPIYAHVRQAQAAHLVEPVGHLEQAADAVALGLAPHRGVHRSEEHTSELQSPYHLVSRLLLETTKMFQQDQYNAFSEDVIYIRMLLL